jgi:hypothetical protein
MYWLLRKEKLVSSLDEFQHLTLPQVRLFCKLVSDEARRSKEERDRKKQLRERKGGQIRIMNEGA